ncbi:MAG: hypothetical protein ACLU4N_09315 [Butyricimonas faecihominis]
MDMLLQGQVAGVSVMAIPVDRERLPRSEYEERIQSVGMRNLYGW